MKKTLKKILAWCTRFVQGTVICAVVLVAMFFAVKVRDAADAARGRETAALAAHANMQAAFADVKSLTPASEPESKPVPELQLATYAPPEEPKAEAKKVSVETDAYADFDSLVLHNEGDFSSAKVDEESQLCLANMIYGEGRDRPVIEQILDGLVLTGRVHDQRDDFGLTVCDAVLKYQQSTGRWQFDGMKSTPTVANKKIWLRIMRLSSSLLRGEYSFSPRMKHVRYFYASNPKAYKNAHGNGKGWLERCTTVVAAIPHGHKFSEENGRCDSKPATVIAKEKLKPLKRQLERPLAVASIHSS